MQAETPGDPRYELLRDPLSAVVADLDALLFQAFGGPSYERQLPHWRAGFLEARYKAAEATRRRADMPVVTLDDFDALTEFLKTGKGRRMCDTCFVDREKLFPIQCQLYVDKSIRSIAYHGTTATEGFLSMSRLIVDEDNFILDGHHRWLSSELMNVRFPLPVYKIHMPCQELFEMLQEFTDKRGNVRNG